jgi:hypothetical protein
MPQLRSFHGLCAPMLLFLLYRLVLCAPLIHFLLYLLQLTIFIWQLVLEVKTDDRLFLFLLSHGLLLVFVLPVLLLKVLLYLLHLTKF